MAESVLASATIEISKFLIQETQSLGAVSDKTKQLQTEMERMQCFLEDADKRQDEDKRVCRWVSEIRELAYDAEDAIETYIVKVKPRREQGFLKKCERYASIFIKVARLYKLSNEIDAIRDKLIDIANSLQRYGIKINDGIEHGSTSHKLQQRPFRRAYSFVTVDHTVGLVSDTNAILEQLLGDEHKHRKVISICGMGGIGKTTLAKKIYHHPEVKRQFNAFAWIYVSQTFKMREILEAILVKLTTSSTKQKKKTSRMNDDKVAKELYHIQQERRCLIILDDIWKKEDWDVLQHAFPIEKIAGMIVLTTRNKTLGRYVNPLCFVHECHTLSEEESWELFQKKAFIGRDYEDIANMEILGRDMVKKCSSLPLAIITLGCILATKYSLNEWSSVHKNVGMYLRKGGDKEYSNVMAILGLSYSELPYHLKPCLLHLSQFPEDYTIPTKLLFRLWMAEGPTEGILENQLNNEETLEDIAEGYLQELIDRCVVLIGEIGPSGRIKSCRLHDLIRELSLSKANQENFLKIIDAKTENSKARRLVVYSNAESIDHVTFENNHHVRSLSGCSHVKSSITRKFKMLRILSLNDCEISKKWIIEIGKLIHLKYLSLDDCAIEYLPSSFGDLRYLQTLILNVYGHVWMPKWKFEDLRHLDFRCQSYNGRELLLIPGNWKNLQTLRVIDCNISVDCKELKNVPNLNFLEINLPQRRSVEVLESAVLNGLVTLFIDLKFNVIKEIELEILLLRCAQLQELQLRGTIAQLPEYHQNFTPNLTKIILISSELEEDPMPVLEKFPKLTFLKLDQAYQGEIMICSSKGFPKLETLILLSLRTLVEWRVDEGAMPSLRHLSIDHCISLKEVPDGIKFINTLSELEINFMPEEFTRRVKVVDGGEGEDYYKTRHVPSIIITDKYIGAIYHNDHSSEVDGVIHFGGMGMVSCYDLCRFNRFLGGDGLFSFNIVDTISRYG